MNRILKNSTCVAIPRVLNILTPALCLLLLSYYGVSNSFAKISIFLSTSVIISMIVDSGSYVLALDQVNKKVAKANAIISIHIYKKIILSFIISSFSLILFVLSFIDVLTTLATLNGCLMGMYGIFIFQYNDSLNLHLKIEIMARALSIFIIMSFSFYFFDIYILCIYYIFGVSIVRFLLFYQYIRKKRILILPRAIFIKVYETSVEGLRYLTSNISNGATSDIFILMSAPLGDAYIVAISVAQYSYKFLKMCLNIISTAVLGPIIFGNMFREITMRKISFFICGCVLLVLLINMVVAILIYTGLVQINIGFFEMVYFLLIVVIASLFVIGKAMLGYPLFMKFKIAHKLAHADILSLFFLFLLFCFINVIKLQAWIFMGIFLLYEIVSFALRLTVFYAETRRTEVG